MLACSSPTGISLAGFCVSLNLELFLLLVLLFGCGENVWREKKEIKFLYIGLFLI